MKTKPTTLRDILDQMAYNLEWIFPDIKGSPRIDREKQNKIKTEAEQAIIELIKSKLPEKLDFKPKNNSTCSFEQTDSYPNPCEHCGGTRAYEWREFTRRNGITPADITGYNQALDQWEQAILELMK